MARYLFGPQLAVKPTDDGQGITGAGLLTGGTVWLDYQKTTQVTDLTTVGGDPISTVDSDADGWTTFKGPDGELGPLYVDFGAGPRMIQSGEAEAETNDRVPTVLDGSLTLAKLSEAGFAKGDLITYTGTDWVRLARGADGQVLTTDAAVTAGLKWATPATGGSGGGLLAVVDTWGAVGDARYCTATTSAGSSTAIIAGTTLTSGDVGKLIAIGMSHTGDSAAGANGHLARIGAVNVGASTVTLHNLSSATVKNATASVSSARTVIGTDDTAGLDAAASALSTFGGGTLRGRPGAKYLIVNSHKAMDGVTLAEMHLIARYDGAPQHLQRCAVAPGFVHGDALDYAGTNAAAAYPHFAVADITEGATSVTGSSAGAISAASALAPGTILGIRSVVALTQGTTKIPHRLVFRRILAKSGDTLQLDGPIPWDVTAASGGGAQVFWVDPNKTATTTLMGAPTWIVQRGGMRDMILDARHPVWGGGAYEWDAINIAPPVGFRWNETITLNTTTRCRFQGWKRCDWTYTFLEVKLGSSLSQFLDMEGTYYGQSGATVYSPISIGESSSDIEVAGMNLRLPPEFSDGAKMFAEVYNCTDVDVHDNVFVSQAAALDAMITVAATTTATYATRGVKFRRNYLRSYASGATGCARTFKISLVSAGSEAAQALHTEMEITDNTIAGLLRNDVYAWVDIRCAQVTMTGNKILIPGAKHIMGGRLSGVHDLGHYGGSDGTAAPIKATSGWYDFSAGAPVTFGQILPESAIITEVLVEVQTTFNGGGTNTFSIGHNATANALAVSVPATAGVYLFKAGITPASGSNGSILGKRFGGLGATSTRRPQITYNGTSPTAGLALVTVFYTTGSPAR